MATVARIRAPCFVPGPSAHRATTLALSCALQGTVWDRNWRLFPGRAGVQKGQHPHARSGKIKCESGQTAPPAVFPEKEVYRGLYPKLSSHSSGHLKVSDLHTIYYEIFGNPTGQPALFLHGGPGAGCTNSHACFFDPEHYRIILFDQRGCGKSTPSGCLEENTTWDLVDDIEKLRQHVGVDRWLVLGGSWGVTLGLAYAQKYPTAVSALVLRGVCLLREQEVDWFYKKGANFLFPFAWEQLTSILEPSEREDVLGSFYKRLTSNDSHVQEAAAQQWLRWEFGLSSFSPSAGVMVWDGSEYSNYSLTQAERSQQGRQRTSSPATSSSGSAPASKSAQPAETTSFPSASQSSTPTQQPARFFGSSRLVQARLECHYFVNRGFLQDNQLLQDVEAIRHIPAVIVQGRYDFVCPVVNAFDLHRAWPEAKLRIVTNAGHSMYEKGITHELVRATDLLRNLD